MYSIESKFQGYLNKKQKILRIGSWIGVPNIKQLIVDMYLSGMSCTEIAEDINNKSPHIKITPKAISDEIGRQGKINGKNYIRNKSESFKLAIEKGRKTYKIKENKYKRVGLTLKTRYQILQRDGFKCVLCGGRHELEVDHILPICLGGDNTPNNLRALCWYCNHGKAQLEK